MEQYLIHLISNYWFWGALGFLAGGAIWVRNLVKNRISFPLAIIACTAGLYGGLIGTRILYVLIFMPQLFLENFGVAVAFWQQTGTWLGAPIGGAIGFFIIFKIAGKPFWENLGACGSGLALAHAIARVGCLFAGCCFGAPTDIPWAIYHSDLQMFVHPTPVYSIIGELVAFLILQYLWEKKLFRKYNYVLYITFLSFHRFISEFFRGADYGPAWIQGLRVFQVVCVASFFLSITVILLIRYRKKALPFTALLWLILAMTANQLQPLSAQQQFEKKTEKPTYLVLTRKAFSAGINDFKKIKEKQGFDVIIKKWEIVPKTESIRKFILNADAKRNLKYILIVGDCDDNILSSKFWHMPSYIFEHTEIPGKFISDSPFADTDGDNLCDIPIGRLPIKDVGQLKDYTLKIVKYNNHNYSRKNDDLLVWVTVPEYSDFFDKWMTDLKNAPQDFLNEINFLNNPENFRKKFCKEIKEGVALSLIISHGSFRSINVRSRDGIFFCNEDIHICNPVQVTGPLLLLSCDTGKFNTERKMGRSLSEEFLLTRGGPVSVMAASGKISPMMNLIMALKIKSTLKPENKDIGKFLINVRKKILTENKRNYAEIMKNSELTEDFIEFLPESAKEKIYTKGLVKKEFLMYNILGDPSIGFEFKTGSENKINGS